MNFASFAILSGVTKTGGHFGGVLPGAALHCPAGGHHEGEGGYSDGSWEEEKENQPPILETCPLACFPMVKTFCRLVWLPEVWWIVVRSVGAAEVVEDEAGW